MTEIVRHPQGDQEVAEPAYMGAANVLIVDDRADNLLALGAALAPLGQNVIRASSGEETLRVLLKEEVAVIILDVQMPGLDGFETATYIKRLDRTKHIPIIFLTAINKEAQHVFRGYSAGAVDYLFKPFDPTVLRSKVRVFIDLYQKKRELQASEERFRKSFEHAPIGVAIVGVDGALIEVNEALCRLMGTTKTDLAARRVHELLHPDEEPLALAALLKELTATGASRHLERRLATQHDEERYALIGVSFISEAVNLGPHFIFQITDITERRQLEAFRERFVSHAAHELRTPVTVIAGTAILLQNNRAGMSEPEMEKCVTALYRQSERLTKMVANLLDLARLEEGRHAVELQPLNLSQVAAKVIEDNPPPEGKEVALVIPTDTLVQADPEAFDHVLSNLLVNAYRYGGSKIEVQAKADGGSTILSVRDDGTGVPKELMAKLFEPFTRGKKASSVGGSGLGLALVKSLVEAGGGEVSYDARPDGGASFNVRLAAPEPTSGDA
jgi:PAS domain S-box-containing protein